MPIVKNKNEGSTGAIPTTGLRAARAVAADRGISLITIWRWSKRKWILTVNISGKVYVDMASLAEFDRKAAAGEFARSPSGAAATSHEARLLSEKNLPICPVALPN